jgi:sigma-B regulation protein RsbU (phosphoserine phosphatase)
MATEPVVPAAVASPAGPVSDEASAPAPRDVELSALRESLAALERRMQDELRLAASVQRALLPPPRDFDGLEFAREFLPFREIGGDYFDVIELPGRRVAIAIGDVMGKGVPAALLAANLKACLRAQLPPEGADPVATITRVNRLFWDVTPKGLFASLFFGVFDFAAGQFEYVNAGHDHPFLVRESGEVLDLRTGGSALGLVEDSTYLRGSVRLRAGDLLAFFSDGLTDRSNRDGEMYGGERLREAALQARRDPVRIILYSLLGEVQGWSNGIPPEDDTTLIVAKVR